MLQHASLLRRLQPLLRKAHHNLQVEQLSSSFATRAAQAASTGLYGIPHLKDPGDFGKWSSRTINRIREMMVDFQAAELSTVVRRLDDMSVELCSVVDTAELCRNTHPDRTWVAAADAAYVQIQGILAELNADSSLHSKLSAARASEAHRSASAEEQRVAAALQHEFERGGIHLSADKRRALDAAQTRALRIGMEYDARMAGRAKGTSLARFPDMNTLAGLPSDVRSHFGAQTDGSVTLPATRNILFRATRYATQTTTRKEVYQRIHAAMASNLDMVAELASSRHEVASILGFPGYAHYTHASALAKDPSGPAALLDKLRDGAWEQAQREKAQMEQLMGGGKIGSWDVAWCGDAAAKHARDSGPLRGITDSGIRSYFPLHQVLAGLTELLQQTLGVRMEERPCAPGEAWAPGVRKLALSHPDEGPLGEMYLDLLPRGGKFQGAAHFVLRSGRRNGDGTYELPKVALVCNFGGNMLMHSEVETFLHEMGHALHSTLSRTEFQHLSGTRGSLDFVEIPSHVFERLVWQPQALALLSGHAATGERLPRPLAEAISAERRLLSATNLQSQVLLAAFDLRIHSERPPRSRADVQGIADELAAHHCAVPHGQGVAWPATFTHVVGYGASYYSYVYAHCATAALWERVLDHEPLDPSAWRDIWLKVLKPGGSADSGEVLEAVLGKGALEVTPQGGRAPAAAPLLRDISTNEKEDRPLEMMLRSSSETVGGGGVPTMEEHAGKSRRAVASATAGAGRARGAAGGVATGGGSGSGGGANNNSSSRR